MGITLFIYGKYLTIINISKLTLWCSCFVGQGKGLCAVTSGSLTHNFPAVTSNRVPLLAKYAQRTMSVQSQRPSSFQTCRCCQGKPLILLTNWSKISAPCTSAGHERTKGAIIAPLQLLVLMLCRKPVSNEPAFLGFLILVVTIKAALKKFHLMKATTKC